MPNDDTSIGPLPQARLSDEERSLAAFLRSRITEIAHCITPEAVAAVNQSQLAALAGRIQAE